MRKSSSTIKVILADDHEIFRDGFSVMINKQPDIELVGEAKDGVELLNKVRELQPEIVITDIKMPKLDGLQVMQQMKKMFPQIGVITLTNYDEEHLIVDMLEAGAKGYLLKSANKEEIVEAIKNVYNNKTHYCHETSTKLAQLIANSSFNAYSNKRKNEFSDREIEVMQLVCKGLTNKEIADKMCLSKRTIETHREQILNKIDESSIAGMVVYAIKHGYHKI